MEANDILLGLARIARLDPRRLTDAAGKWLPFHKWPDDVALAVAGLDMSEGEITKVRFNERNQALQLLARHKKLLEPENGALTATVNVIISGDDANLL